MRTFEKLYDICKKYDVNIRLSIDDPTGTPLLTIASSDGICIQNGIFEHIFETEDSDALFLEQIILESIEKIDQYRKEQKCV